VHPTIASPPDDGAGGGPGEHLGERIEALAGWIQELDAQIRATTAAGDEKTLKELSRALEAWSKRDPKFEERLTDRVDVLADRVATLSSTVNTAAAANAASEGELACLRRELEQTTSKLEAAIREKTSSGDGRALEELRRTVADLSGRRSKGADADVSDLRAKIDYVGERVDTLAATVASTAAGLAGREGELVALRRSLDDVGVQIAQLAADARREVSGTPGPELEARLQEVAAAQREGETQLESRLQTLDERLQARVEEVTSKIESASRNFAAGELELAALKRHLEETAARVEAEVRDVREELPRSLSPGELDERLAPLLAQLETLASRVAEGDAVTTERLERELDRLSDVERRLADADARLADAERAAEAAGTEARRAGDARSDERGRVQEQLDSLVQAVSETPTKHDLAAPLAAVSGRLARLEEAGPRLEEALHTVEEKLAAQPAVSAEDVESKLEPVHTQLEALSRRLEETERAAGERSEADTAQAAEVDDLVASIKSRIEAVEQAAETAAAKARRAGEARTDERARVQEQLDALVQAVSETPTKRDVEALAARLDALPEPETPVPPSQDEELERLLTAFADRIDAIEAERAVTAQAGRTADEAVVNVRASLDSLAERLSSAEELLTARDPHELEDQVEALSSRLEVVETAAKTPPPGPTSGPGDGRFRVELRALELRMEHAEVAARENREAVLVQLERLAARLEWRLQRLESGQAPEIEAPAEPEPLGQVVPIRGGAET